MKIYISHSRAFDFKKDLYQPLHNSFLNKQHEFILPHEFSDAPYPVKDLFEKHGCDLVIAEVSFPSTGQGIELGWANQLKIPVVCIYQKGIKYSGSLKVVSDTFIEYEKPDALIKALNKFLNHGC